MSIRVLTAVVADLSRRPRRAAAALTLAMMCAWPGLAAAQGARQTPREAVQALIPGSSATDVAAVASAVVTQVASVPLGSSSGGFTFVRDPRTGMLTLKTETFGPSFAERPITLGKAGAFSIGTSYQRTDFDTFEGLSLRTGDLRAELHLDGAPVVDLFSTTLDVTIATTSVVANIGLFDTFDVGVTVPFVRLSFAGMRTSGVPGAGAALVRDVQTSGLGDIQVRAKWAPVQSEHAAMAAAVEVSLPTGDAERLIGTGHWRPRLLFLGSTTSGRLSPHVNLSYRFGGRGAEVRTPAGGFGELLHADVGHELGYTLGLESPPIPRSRSRPISSAGRCATWRASGWRSAVSRRGRGRLSCRRSTPSSRRPAAPASTPSTRAWTASTDGCSPSGPRPRSSGAASSASTSWVHSTTRGCDQASRR